MLNHRTFFLRHRKHHRVWWRTKMHILHLCLFDNSGCFQHTKVDPLGRAEYYTVASSSFGSTGSSISSSSDWSSTLPVCLEQPLLNTRGTAALVVKPGLSARKTKVIGLRWQIVLSVFISRRLCFRGLLVARGEEVGESRPSAVYDK